MNPLHFPAVRVSTIGTPMLIGEGVRLKSLDEIVAAKPTPAYDAGWGKKGMQM
jgi:hypothetical protein